MYKVYTRFVVCMMCSSMSKTEVHLIHYASDFLANQEPFALVAHRSADHCGRQQHRQYYYRWHDGVCMCLATLSNARDDFSNRLAENSSNWSPCFKICSAVTIHIILWYMAGWYRNTTIQVVLIVWTNRVLDVQQFEMIPERTKKLSSLQYQKGGYQ